MRASSRESSPRSPQVDRTLVSIESLADFIDSLSDADTTFHPSVAAIPQISETMSTRTVSLERLHFQLVQMRQDISHEMNLQIKSAVSRLRSELVTQLSSQFPSLARCEFQGTMRTSADAQTEDIAKYVNKQEGVLNLEDHRSTSEGERASPNLQAMPSDADRSPGNAGRENHQIMHPSSWCKLSSTFARSVTEQRQSMTAVVSEGAKGETENLFLAGSSKIKLPPCIYSTPLLIKWCLYGRHSHSFLGDHIVLNLLVMQWLALFGHYFLTLGFLFYVHKVTQHKISMMEPGGCLSKQTFSTLRILALAAFSMCCFLDFIETRDMAFWLRLIAVEKTHQPCFEIKTLDTGERIWANGLTRNQKQLFRVVILVPKLAIGVLLLIVGIRYILVSKSNEELILNCLAMLFVRDIDDIIYQVFTPDSIQVAMEGLPSVHYDRSSRPRMFLLDFVFGPCLRALVLAIVVAVAISLECSFI